MSDLIGATIGNLTIVREIGRGGMGVVYEATSNTLRKPRAIKVLLPKLAAEANSSERFIREAQAMDSLEHPNIAKIYDCGKQGDLFYIVMEFADKGTLKGDLLSGQVALPLALDYMYQAALALDAAHRKGMIHRDVKPDNMLLFSNDSGGKTLKLADFGLVRVEERSDLSSIDFVLGTPLYMSPEQCLGAVLESSTDIYSLGVVFFELVTGAPPFMGDSARVRRDHVKTPPPVPSFTNPNLPAEVENIILRCLAKSPEQRFQSAAEVAKAIDEVRILLRQHQHGNDSVLEELLLQKPAPTPEQSQTPIASKPMSPVDDGKETVVQAPIRPSTPPIKIPLVRVFDTNGQMIIERQVTEVGLVVGRQAAGLRLESEAVSRKHLEITWDGSNQITVKDTSTNGTLLDNNPLVRDKPTVWPWDKTLVVGPYRLELVQPYAAAIPTHPSENTGLEGRPEIQQTKSSITINLPQRKLTLKTNQELPVTVQMSNQSAYNQHIKIEVEGVPPQWVRGLEQVVGLIPNTQATVQISILAPRKSDSRAKEYKVIVRGRSANPERPGVSNDVEVSLTVEAFIESSLQLKPATASGYRKATYTALLINDGNAPARYTLSASDPNSTLRFRYGTGIPVAPGGVEEQRVEVSRKAHLMGIRRKQEFTVEAVTGEHQLRPVKAEFVQWPYIPAWAPPLLLIVLFFLASYLTQPFIDVKSPEPSKPLPGTEVTINWDARNWQFVELRGIEPRPTVLAPTTSYTYVYSNSQPVGITVVAINDILGIPRRASQGILVEPGPTPIPDKPVVDSFDVQPRQVVFGEEVTISWVVRNAVEVKSRELGDKAKPEGTSSTWVFSETKIMDNEGSNSFSIRAVSADGSTADSPTRVVVVSAIAPTPRPAPEIAYFRIEPERVTRILGQPILEPLFVRWSTDRNATSWIIEGGPQISSNEGRLPLPPPAVNINSLTIDTVSEYILKASNPDNEEPSTLTAILRIELLNCSVVTTSALNMREGPDVKYNLSGELAPGTIVFPFKWDANKDWLRVRVQNSGRDGWIRQSLNGSDLVSCSDQTALTNVPIESLAEIPALPTLAPTPVPPSTNTPRPVTVQPPTVQAPSGPTTTPSSIPSKYWLNRGEINSPLFNVDVGRQPGLLSGQQAPCIIGSVVPRNGGRFRSYYIGLHPKGGLNGDTQFKTVFNAQDFAYCPVTPGEWGITLYSVNERDLTSQEQVLMQARILVKGGDEHFHVIFTAKVDFP